jgi:hypothetical protein
MSLPVQTAAVDLLSIEMNGTHLREFGESEHYVATVHGDRAHYADGDLVEAVDFDFDAVDEALGLIHRTPPQAREQAAELFRALTAWCFKDGRPLRSAMVKWIAIISGLRPDLLENRSGRELAEELGVSKQALTHQSVRFSDAWQIQFARGRLKESRERMAAARRGGPNRNTGARNPGAGTMTRPGKEPNGAVVGGTT